MNKKKLWVLSELFYPEETATSYIITEIAETISQNREVNVICGPVSYEKKSNRESGRTLNSNIKIDRINLVDLDKNHLFLRTIRVIVLAILMSYRLFIKSKKDDDVFIATNPAPLLLLVGYISSIKKLNLYILVHDVFPENVLAAGMIKTKSLLLKILNNLFDKAYSKADILIVLGRDMQVVIENKIQRYKHHSKIEIIENWADIENIIPSTKEDNVLLKELGLSNKIVFQYAGNLGRVQGLQNLISIISEVKNPLIYFLFIGEGAIKNNLQKFIADYPMTNIKILPSMPRSSQNIFLNACDVSIVCLTDNMFGLGVPSKSYNIMAAAKPILFIGDKRSEIALTIEEFGNGWVFESNDRQFLINFFNSIDNDFLKECFEKGLKGRQLAQFKYSKSLILNKFKKLLTEC